MTGVLDGRAAIVTGGSHGLGLEIARTYLAAGARVLVCARDATPLERARTELESAADPTSIETVAADVSEPGDVEALVAHALERFAMEAGCTVHVESSGADDHHVAEAAFKALGQALGQAVAPGVAGVRSTKGAA